MNSHYYKTFNFSIPSDKQIEFADSIAKELGIDFPTSSKDFTAKTYWQFVNKYRNDFDLQILEEKYADPDDIPDYFYDNDVWCEHY